MADNSTLDNGDIIAADEIAGVKHQRFKLQLGADGVANDVAPGAQGGLTSVPIVGAKDDVRITSVTLTPSTAILAAGEVVVDSQIISACFKADDALGVLHSFTLIDPDAQAAQLYVVLLSANIALGTENSPPSISDANADNILGWFAIQTADYLTINGVSVASIKNIGLDIKAVAGGDDIYIGIINGTGTPTYAGGGLTGRIGILG